MSKPYKPKLMIFGVDAADFNIILNNRASLKTFDFLCKDGSFGKVQSCFWSCDIWTTYYTGLSPANHGVQYIRLSNPLSKNVYSPSSPLCLWNVINKQNLSFGMIEGLVTYPAPKVNGFFWSGKPTYGYGEYALSLIV